MDIAKIQKLLQEAKLDGWLFTDFQGHDFITKEFLELGNRFCTRRLFYLIPSQGEPTKVLSAIEPLLLDHLPGEKNISWNRRTEKSAVRAVEAGHEDCLPVLSRRKCSDDQLYGCRSDRVS